MNFRPVNSQNSHGQTLGQLNDMLRQLNKEQQVKVFKGPGGNNALITGKLPNDLGYGFQFNDSSDTPLIVAYIDPVTGGPVMKISPAGVDATTATDDQLLFNSSRKVFKIIDEVNLSVPVTNSPGTYGSYTDFEAHGLGFAPAYLAFVDFGSGRTICPAVEYSAFGVPPSQVLEPTIVRHVTVDSTNVTAIVETTANVGFTYDFTVYLLQETAG